ISIDQLSRRRSDEGGKPQTRQLNGRAASNPRARGCWFSADVLAVVPARTVSQLQRIPAVATLAPVTGRGAGARRFPVSYLQSFTWSSGAPSPLPEDLGHGNG